jgi:TP901 family phage tail tape measure protein
MANSARFAVDTIFRALDQMTAPVRKMQGSVGRFAKATETELAKVDRITGRVIGGVHTAVATATAGVGALAAALTVAAQPGLSFEQQIANLGATSLQTRDQIQDLEKKALELGAATQFSATEVAAGMEQMAKAGFENHEVLDGISGMVYAAAAAGEELASTTEHVSSVMKGMGLSTKEAARVADVLALASVRTNSSIASLAESMSNVSSTARQLKVPLEDAVGMVALLQDVGLDASEAGSAVATMFSKMAAPTDEMRAKMKKLKVDFADASGNMLEPAKVLEQLVKAGKDAGGTMETVAFFTDLVGMRGQKAALNLKDLFAGGQYTKLVDELVKKADGTAKKMSDLRMNTATGDIDIFTESVKGLSIELFAMASGPLREMVQGMTKWVDANKDLITSGIKEHVTWLVENLPAIAKWGARIAIVVGTWYAIAAAVKAATVAAEIFNVVAALNPYVLIAMAIVAALTLIVAFWPEISAFFQDLWKGLVEIASFVGDAIADAVMAVWEPVKKFVVSAFNAFWQPILAGFEFYVGLMTMIWGPVLKFLEPAFEWVKEAVGAIASAMLQAASWILERWLAVFDFYVGFWTAVYEYATKYFDFVAGIVGVVAEKFMAVWGKVAAFFKDLWQGVKDAFLAIVDPIFARVKGFIDAVRSVGRSTMGTDTAGEPNQSVEPTRVSSVNAATMSSGVAGSLAQVVQSSAEVTIRDATGRAQLTRAPTGPMRIMLVPTGMA